jgi:hypothetical protein
MGNSGISCISQAAPPQGVLAHQASATDLLFITLRKSEALFSPTTRYRDLALGPSLFHWESQSTTTAASPTGQRYIHHAIRGSRVLLYRWPVGDPGGVVTGDGVGGLRGAASVPTRRQPDWEHRTRAHGTHRCAHPR